MLSFFAQLHKNGGELEAGEIKKGLLQFQPRQTGPKHMAAQLAFIFKTVPGLTRAKARFGDKICGKKNCPSTDFDPAQTKTSSSNPTPKKEKGSNPTPRKAPELTISRKETRLHQSFVDVKCNKCTARILTGVFCVRCGTAQRIMEEKEAAALRSECKFCKKRKSFPKNQFCADCGSTSLDMTSPPVASCKLATAGRGEGSKTEMIQSSITTTHKFRLLREYSRFSRFAFVDRHWEREDSDD
jgi:hypothetical protein